MFRPVHSSRMHLALNLKKYDSDPFYENKEFELYCEKTCDKEWTHFCSSFRQRQEQRFFVIQCMGPLNDPKSNSESQQVSPETLCDEQLDCTGGADEARCPGRYYCKGRYNHWVMLSEVCDHKKDCPQGDDECQDCSAKTNSSGVASDLDMVQNRVIRYYMVIAALMIVVLNVFAMIEVYKMKPESKTGKVDRLILGTVCFYDTLMGGCLGFTFVKSMVFSGKYCAHDNET